MSEEKITLQAMRTGKKLAQLESVINQKQDEIYEVHKKVKGLLDGINVEDQYDLYDKVEIYLAVFGNKECAYDKSTPCTVGQNVSDIAIWRK